MYSEIRTAAQGGKNLSIGVIGDICVDAYYFLHEEGGEISVETGKPAYSVENYYFDLGGAANVALNLKRLGTGRVELFGIIGDDPFGKILDTQAREAGIFPRWVVQRENWATHVYSKIYKAGEEQPRLDMGNFNTPSKHSIDALIAAFEGSLPHFDGVILNEQVFRGFQSAYFQEKLLPLIRTWGEKQFWVCDCRNLNDRYVPAIHKLNAREALALYNAHHPEEPFPEPLGGAQELKTIIQWLYARWGKPVILTQGDNGALAFDGNRMHRTLGLHIINPIDTVGAGDAFLSGLTFGLGSGLSLAQALELGNFSAGVSVQKLFQTGHPSLEEILNISEEPDYRYNPELADNPQDAVYLEGTEIEIIAKPAPGTPRIIIFDHDGTISTIRLGWETVMEEVMIRCILGDSYAAVSGTQYGEVQQTVRDFINRTTGIQTLSQMGGLEKMVRDFGYVPEERILDPPGYKKIYNNRLLELVKNRIRRLQGGKLSVEDCTVKGAVSFLHRLQRAGITLYLASGTDADDVRHEAAVLGYDPCFTRIYGSLGNIARDPKQVVFENILAELGPAAARCAVFGDGPVELREARKNGAAAIGLVSNEVQRFGINPHKRNRLILAGADALIPDYSWTEELAAWLGWDI